VRCRVVSPRFDTHHATNIGLDPGLCAGIKTTYTADPTV